MDHTEAARAPNRVLLVISIALLVYCVIMAAAALGSVPVFYQRAITQTLPDVSIQLVTELNNELIAQQAEARGLTLRQYALFRIAVDLLYAGSFFAAALMIALRARRNWYLWFTAWIMVFFPLDYLSKYLLAAGLGQNVFLAGWIAFWPFFPLFLYLFPNGKAVPRWMLWLLAPLLLAHFLMLSVMVYALAVGYMPEQAARLEPLLRLVVLPFPLAILSQVYRYLRVSSPVERLQTRWVIFGTAFALVFSLATTLISQNWGVRSDFGYASDLDQLVFIIFPITVGISILRYRLWDVDLLIRRTLVYGILTGLLALLYFGSVVLIQMILRLVIGQGSPLAVVISTLAVAALFNPLRLRIQGWIDRSFYRQKYNAERLVDDFAARLKTEVNLGELNQYLLAVTEESLQPESQSLWLRKREEKE